MGSAGVFTKRKKSVKSYLWKRKNGSNSKLLGSEIANSLRGRTLRFEIFPLSFREYLNFNGIEIDLYSSKQLAFIRNAQSSFLKDGGFPELLFVEERYRIALLQEYFHVLLYRDLIEMIPFFDFAVRLYHEDKRGLLEEVSTWRTLLAGRFPVLKLTKLPA